MSLDVELIALCKMISLLIFAPIYVGALVYACWKPNRAAFDRLAMLPLLDDEGT